MAVLTAEELNDNLALRDLADPAQGPHAIQLVVDQVRAALGQAWPYTEIWTRRDHPVVTLADNYDNLGYAAGAVTREERYTRYASPTQVLRSHTSAMIPPALRELAASKEASDVLMVCAGICYRRDSVDWQHTGTPHQLDLWRISRNVTLGEPELEAMIAKLVETVLPGQTYRTVPAVHPYTIHGRQIDVLLDDQWIEIGECGVAAPAVLRNAGLDESWTGLAMGPGLDRLVMLRKGIRDIRLLRSTDPRVAGQLLDLSPYKPVSAMPAVRRDLSVVVGPDVDISDEVLGDRVRQALGVDADVAESVEVRGETSYDELPAAARERLQLEPGQRNVLVRLVLRPLDRTLTDGDANRLRDQVYSALHEGPVLELIGR
ncbi:MAG: phenylalanyl-tRNA synthetase alpha chain [Kribbellaceae bacterium]|nr:phenylalanyl-tRNA synthetase alpha chain [Kribbellaceae bacterium]